MKLPDTLTDITNNAAWSVGALTGNLPPLPTMTRKRSKWFTAAVCLVTVLAIREALRA